MNRIRVAHVITRLCRGGAQENTFHTVRLSNPDRYSTDLISGPTIGAEGTIEDQVRDASIPIMREPHLIRNASPIPDMLALSGLTRMFRRNRYHIVHTHTSKAGAIGRLAAKRAHVPIIVHTPHGNIFNGYFAPWKTRLFVHIERRAARWTDRIVELTPGGIEEHLGKGIGCREQYVSIFSGIDLAPYNGFATHRSHTRSALGLQSDDFLVGAVGRLEPVKGFQYFIEAAKRIAGAAPNVRFILAGQGSMERELREGASCIGDRFSFLGPRDDIPDLMAAMDVLIVPSLNEGMGRVLLEAGAAHTPAVASNVGGIPEVVRDGETGTLVPPGSPESIAEAVLDLYADRARLERFGRAAHRRVVPEYGLEHMVVRIESMYEDLLREKKLDA